MPDVVMLIRHAEKPVENALPVGVMEDGDVDGESLTPRGWQRAEALVAFFVGAGTRPGSSGLPVPSQLFASKVGPLGSSRRSLETLQPLAKRLGLQVDTRFLKEQIGPLAQAILAAEGVVLVSWEHHLIPSLAAMLISQPMLVPHIWPDDRFDVVWVFERGGGTGFRFHQVAEGLLAGDSMAPIEDTVPGS